MQNTIHMMLQGKGGVGKSFIDVMLSQYLLAKFPETPLINIDTDPVNATFSQYEALNVGHIAIVENNIVSSRKFDTMIENMITTDGANFVVDNGASTFLPLAAYIAENEVFQMLAESGKKVYIHTVVTAGQAMIDTLNGLNSLIEIVGDNAKIVVWQNEFWGEITDGDKKLPQFKVIQKNSDKIIGLPKIVNRGSSDTYSVDIRTMTEKHLTLNEVKVSEEFGLVAKSRLTRVFNDVYAELDAVNW